MWAGLALLVLAPFFDLFRATSREWFSNPTFSYGALIPLIVAYFIWQRRAQLTSMPVHGSLLGLLLLIVGCLIHLMGTLSGIMLVSAVGFTIVLIGAVAFLFGKAQARVVGLTLCLLMFMVPWPTYTIGELSWRLQEIASSISARLLQLSGTTVYQDGNLLVLPNYILEVKEVCSGTRSIFALLALAGVLALLMNCHWVWRVTLLMLSPVMALLANIIRIVGTGVAAVHYGRVAANETLHAIWGVMVFLLAVAGLLGMERLLRWASYKCGSP